MRLQHWLGAAFMGLCLQSGLAFADDMQFDVVPLGDQGQCGSRCLELIGAQGEIVSSTPQDFMDFVKSHMEDSRIRLIVLLDSPGGDVNAALKLGTILRKMGAATIVAKAGDNLGQPVPGHCYSACVYTLMGGKKRVIPPGSSVGIHRAYSIAVGPDLNHGHGATSSDINVDTGVVGDAIALYSQKMGISRDLIDTAQKTMPDSIHIVTEEEARRWRLGVPTFEAGWGNGGSRRRR